MDESLGYNSDPNREIGIRDFINLEKAFFDRIASRYLRLVAKPNIPHDDSDVVSRAIDNGFNIDLITSACVLARKRLEGQTNLSFVNLDTVAIAKINTPRYAVINDTTGNPNLN